MESIGPKMRKVKTDWPRLALVAVIVALLVAVSGWALWGLGRGPTYTGSALNPSIAAPVALMVAAERPPADRLVFADGDGKALTLEDFRGRAMLVNLWATWCGPCVAEMPALDALEAKLGGTKFQVVAVALESGGAAVAKSWMERNGIGHLGLYAARLADFPNALLPSSWLIDAQGRLAWHGLGARAWDDPAVQAEIVKLMGE